jgi:hypothetical protein
MGHRHSLLYILIGSAAVLPLFVISGERLRGQSEGTAGTSMADPNSYIFRLQLGGLDVGDYTECTGLGSSNDVDETEVSTDAGSTVIQKRPAALRWPDIALQRKGIISERVWSWRAATEQGKADAAFRDGSILVIGPGNHLVDQWDFHFGWAARLTFDGAMEQLVIVHQGLSRPTGEPAPTRTVRQ